MSKKQYRSLKYWANVGYGAKGRAYTEAFPKRKDPWYKINQPVLDVTVGELLSEYIVELQEYLQANAKANNKGPEVVAINQVSHSLINILLKGYGVHKEDI